MAGSLRQRLVELQKEMQKKNNTILQVAKIGGLNYYTLGVPGDLFGGQMGL